MIVSRKFNEYFGESVKPNMTFIVVKQREHKEELKKLEIARGILMIFMKQGRVEVD